MTLSGSGWNTNPQSILWFCHVCAWSGYLRPGEFHQCKPQTDVLQMSRSGLGGRVAPGDGP